MTSFVLARDAKLGAPATTIALCPTMDLVVVACANGGTLTAFRLNWNKLWTKTLAPELETPTRATFRPDGKVLVVGYPLHRDDKTCRQWSAFHRRRLRSGPRQILGAFLS